MTGEPNQPLTVKCPTCGTPVQYHGPGANPYFPFCRRRCKLIDLGRWLEEEHRIEEPVEERLQRGEAPRPEEKQDG